MHDSSLTTCKTQAIFFQCFNFHNLCYVSLLNPPSEIDATKKRKVVNSSNEEKRTPGVWGNL